MSINNKTFRQAARSNDKISAGENMNVARLGQRVVVSGENQSAIAIPGSAIFAVSFVEEFDNWFTAYRYNWKDGSLGMNLLCVAKPPYLRRDIYESWDEGIEYPNGDKFLYEYIDVDKRRATDITNEEEEEHYSETQQITPSYYVGQIILVATAQSGLISDEGATISLVELSDKTWARYD